MFSSCVPTSALVEGVKIGSGSRSLSRRPAGSRMPADRPGAPVVLPAGARDVAADDHLDRQRPGSGGRSSIRPRSSAALAGGLDRQVGRVGRQEVVGHDAGRSRRTRTGTGRSGRGPCPGSASAGRRRTPTADPRRRAASRSSSRSYRSRTLPERTNAPREGHRRQRPRADRAGRRSSGRAGGTPRRRSRRRAG